MNILISVNSRFLVPAKVLLYSLYKTQSDKVNIYFLNISCIPKEVQELMDLSIDLGFDFKCLELSEENRVVIQQKAHLLKKNELAVETYARLFAPILLPELDRILWLDADCLVRQDLKDFYYQDLHGKYAAACDHSNWDLPEVPVELYPRKSYCSHFNAGVVLFDLNQCRKIKGFHDGNIQQVILGFTGAFFDQGILNFLIPPERVAWADPLLYNCSVNQDWEHGLKNHPVQWQVYPNAAILHYCSTLEKPWNLLTSSDFRKRQYWFEDYLELQQFLTTIREKPFKIAVYTICKDEIRNITDYLENVKDADYICLLDTGSTDQTWESLLDYQEALGKDKLIIRQQVFENFRFDDARNESRKLIPEDTDICICLDLDERLSENWREDIQVIFTEFRSQMKILPVEFEVPFTEYDKGEVFRYSNTLSIHSNSPDAVWKGAVHEILVSPDTAIIRYSDKPEIYHYPLTTPDNKRKKKELYDSLLPLREKDTDAYNLNYTNAFLVLYEGIQANFPGETTETLAQKIQVFSELFSGKRVPVLEDWVLLAFSTFVLENELKFSVQLFQKLRELFDLMLVPARLRSEKQQAKITELSDLFKDYKGFDNIRGLI